MMHIVQSEKSMDRLASDLEKAVLENKFGVMAIHNLKETMAKKGVEFTRDCRIFEVCNPNKAKAVLEADMRISMALPCRISLYEEGGKRILATLLPTAMLGMFDRPELADTAKDVEQTMIKIMEEAAK